MKVYLNEINGLWAAIDAMFFSKRTWTREKEVYLMNLYAEHFDRWGRRIKEPNAEMLDLIEKAFKWARTHITLNKFLDFGFTVEGLHRGAQDDFDSHAKRLDNRIIRSSTRLADFGSGEKSDWYKGKILTTDEVLNFLHIQLPDSIELEIEDGATGKSKGTAKFIRTVNGYIREDVQNSKDVKRGLYMLSIPSNFIFKCNCTEFAHIVQERDADSTAHPELRLMIEECKRQLAEHLPQLTTEWYHSVKN